MAKKPSTAFSHELDVGVKWKAQRGTKTTRADQSTEVVSRVLDLRAYHRRVTLDFSRPGKPTDNAFIKGLNGKFRLECLNAHWFMSLDDAQAKCETWSRDYNEVRPHSALVKRSSAAGPP